jgi:hypothetical protein
MFSYIKHGEYCVVLVSLYTEIQNLMNVSWKLHVIFEVSNRVSVKFTTWERIFAFVTWVEGYCYTLAVVAAEFLVALLSVCHSGQHSIPEYINFHNTYFLIFICLRDTLSYDVAHRAVRS